jgi:hypothetical protein
MSGAILSPLSAPVSPPAVTRITAGRCVPARSRPALFLQLRKFQHPELRGLLTTRVIARPLTLAGRGNTLPVAGGLTTVGAVFGRVLNSNPYSTTRAASPKPTKLSGAM